MLFVIRLFFDGGSECSNLHQSWKRYFLLKIVRSFSVRSLCPAFFCLCFLALVARQFVEINRIRIEVRSKVTHCLFWHVELTDFALSVAQGMLAAFPKLMGTDLKQHTFVETEAVRYSL